MTELLIFDFDGLILDTEGPDYESWREIFEEHGCALPMDEWAAGIGAAPGTVDECSLLAEALGRPVDREALRDRRRQRYFELIEEKDLMPGVAECLADAKRLGVRCVIASSAPRSWVTRHLSRFGLMDAFECLKSTEDVENSKPHPDLFLAALEATGVPASNAVVFEDSPNGVEAAARAGIFCVAVPNVVTARFPMEQANMRVGSLADMPLEELLKVVESRKEGQA